ncbi:MAG: SCO family protein [Gemmatimonadaceae bacterium]
MGPGSPLPVRARWLGVLAGLLASVVGVSCGEPMRGVEIADAEAAPPLRLVAADSTRFDLAEHKGSIVLVYFGYTHCPDVCPTTLSDWAQARRALGDRAARVQFVFVSVDPERDTPELAQAYARQFDRAFVGLTGTEAQIDSMKAAWRIAAYPEGDTRTRAYSVAHPAYTFLVDRQGRLRFLYEPGVRGEELARDLRKLL